MEYDTLELERVNIVEHIFPMQIAKTIHNLINYVEPMLRT